MSENNEIMPPQTGPSDDCPKSSAPSFWDRPLYWWARKLFACNPFYLLSAALLLYGCYRISVDASLFHQETAWVMFNFTSVQVYEVLLVITAIFLARRRLWYDSTLLVGLENLLVFVPFILISQAALIDSGLAMVMCLAGTTFAFIRFGGLKRYFVHLNLPGRLLQMGSVLLLLNVLLPLCYRHFGQTKIGLLDSGAAYEMNQCTWRFILPLTLVLVNGLPRSRPAGNILPGNPWLPLGFASLWLVVTFVHVYALDYIYQFDLRDDLLAPTAWVLAWTISRQCAGAPVLWRYAMLVPPLFTPLIALLSDGKPTFLILCGLNLIGYGLMRFYNRKHRLASHLAFASGLLFITALPDAWFQRLHPGLCSLDFVFIGLVGYLIFWTALSRNPKLAVVAALACGLGVGIAFGGYAAGVYWAFESALVFLLLHSLRWNDAEHPGAIVVRVLAGLSWGIVSFAWVYSGAGRFWMPCVPGFLVLAIACVFQMRNWQWSYLMVLVAAALAIVAGPFGAMFDRLCRMPVGLLAMVGSFVLFGSGTAAALTRYYWHKPESSSASSVTVASQDRDIPTNG